MTPVQAIIRQTQRPLYILAGAAVLALALIFGSMYTSTNLQQQLGQDDIQATALKSELAQKKLDLKNIQAHIDKFHALKQQGLVGVADREGWVEQFVSSRQTVGIGSAGLNYTLEPPKPLSDIAGAEADNAAVTDPSAPLQHDLVLELQGIHEVELLNLLHDYKTKVDGRFRVQSCEFSGPTSTGLLARCTLRFFNLPEPPKAP